MKITLTAIVLLLILSLGASAVDFKIKALEVKDGDGQTIFGTKDADGHQNFRFERSRIYDICTTVQNDASAGTAMSEAGFIERSLANQFFSPIAPLALVQDVGLCVPDEDFRVDALKITLNQGESVRACHTVFAPTSGSDTEWALFSETYLKCGGGSGNVQSIVVARATLTDPTGIATSTATCSDSIRNQGETDVDCGGAVCGKCAENKKCHVNADCTQPLSCATVETSQEVLNRCIDLSSETAVTALPCTLELCGAKIEEGVIVVRESTCSNDISCISTEKCLINADSQRQCATPPESPAKECEALDGSCSALSSGFLDILLSPVGILGIAILIGVGLYVGQTKRKRR